MAVVRLEIGDRQFNVACREGGQARLQQAGAMIAGRWADAERAAGNHGAFRVMLFVALMMADDLIDKDSAAVDIVPPALPSEASLDWIADRLDALAEALETSVPNA